MKRMTTHQKYSLNIYRANNAASQSSQIDILHESCRVFSSATTNPCSIPGRCCSRAFTQFSMLLKQHKKKPPFQFARQTPHRQPFIVCVRACSSVILQLKKRKSTIAKRFICKNKKVRIYRSVLSVFGSFVFDVVSFVEDVLK